MKRGSIIACVLITATVLVQLAGCHGSSPPQLEPPPPVAPERQDITAAQLQTMIDTSQHVALVDVRTNQEYTAGHIPGSINQPLANIDEWSQRISKDTGICCICASGYTSRQAAAILLEKGFTEVYNLLGGMNGWPGDIEAGCGCGP